MSFGSRFNAVWPCPAANITAYVRCGPPSRAYINDESRHRGWFLSRRSGPRGCTFSRGLPPPGARGQNSSHIPPRPSDWLGGIPTIVLCCDANRGGPRQHYIEGENSASAHAASTRPGIGIDRTWSWQPYIRTPRHQPQSSGRVQRCPGLH